MCRDKTEKKRLRSDSHFNLTPTLLWSYFMINFGWKLILKLNRFKRKIFSRVEPVQEQKKNRYANRLFFFRLLVVKDEKDNATCRPSYKQKSHVVVIMCVHLIAMVILFWLTNPLIFVTLCVLSTLTAFRYSLNLIMLRPEQLSTLFSTTCWLHHLVMIWI